MAVTAAKHQNKQPKLIVWFWLTQIQDFFFVVKPRSWAEPESWQSIQYVIGIVKQKSQTNRFVQVTTEEKPYTVYINKL